MKWETMREEEKVEEGRMGSFMGDDVWLMIPHLERIKKKNIKKIISQNNNTLNYSYRQLQSIRVILGGICGLTGLRLEWVVWGFRLMIRWVTRVENGARPDSIIAYIACNSTVIGNLLDSG